MSLNNIIISKFYYFNYSEPNPTQRMGQPDPQTTRAVAELLIVFTNRSCPNVWA